MANRHYNGVRRRALLSIPWKHRNSIRAFWRHAALRRLDEAFSVVRRQNEARLEQLQRLQDGAR